MAKRADSCEIIDQFGNVDAEEWAFFFPLKNGLLILLLLFH